MKVIKYHYYQYQVIGDTHPNGSVVVAYMGKNKDFGSFLRPISKGPKTTMNPTNNYSHLVVKRFTAGVIFIFQPSVRKITIRCFQDITYVL